MFKIASPGPIIFDISHVHYMFKVHDMSSDKLHFIVPNFFDIGPCKDKKVMLKYVTFMYARHMRCNHVNDLVKDVIKREIRVAAASMTMEEINSSVKLFKE